MARSGTVDAQPRHRLRRGIAIASVVVAVLAVLAAIAWFTVVPYALANLTTRVLEADESVEVGTGSVVVPAGWAVQHPPFEPETVVLITPDGGLEIAVSESGEAPDAALAAVGATGAPQHETLGNGLRAAHLRTGTDRIDVALAAGDAPPSLVFSARATGGDITPYTRAIAGILDGAVMGPGAP